RPHRRRLGERRGLRVRAGAVGPARAGRGGDVLARARRAAGARRRGRAARARGRRRILRHRHARRLGPCGEALHRMTSGVVFRARAPLRLSFCGGGTDVSPYPEEHGGMVLSATINQYAYASLRPRRDTRFTLASLDYDVVARFDHPRRMRADGKLDLIKAVVRHFRPPRGADLWVHSDAPPGSGLGSSSTLVVALIGAMTEWLRRPLSGYE